MKRRRILTLVAAWLLALALCTNALAAEYNVSDVAELRDAVNNSVDGDTIRLAQGEYVLYDGDGDGVEDTGAGALEIKTGITIQGAQDESGNATSTIAVKRNEGTGEQFNIRVDASEMTDASGDVTIVGIIIRNDGTPYMVEVSDTNESENQVILKEVEFVYTDEEGQNRHDPFAAIDINGDYCRAIETGDGDLVYAFDVVLEDCTFNEALGGASYSVAIDANKGNNTDKRVVDESKNSSLTITGTEFKGASHNVYATRSDSTDLYIGGEGEGDGNTFSGRGVGIFFNLTDDNQVEIIGNNFDKTGMALSGSLKDGRTQVNDEQQHIIKDNDFSGEDINMGITNKEIEVLWFPGHANLEDNTLDGQNNNTTNQTDGDTRFLTSYWGANKNVIMLTDFDLDTKVMRFAVGDTGAEKARSVGITYAPAYAEDEANRELTPTGTSTNYATVARAEAITRWYSSDPSVATVDPATGLVTPVGPGQCYVYAVVGGGTEAALNADGTFSNLLDNGQYKACLVVIPEEEEEEDPPFRPERPDDDPEEEIPLSPVTPQPDENGEIPLGVPMTGDSTNQRMLAGISFILAALATLWALKRRA